MDTPINSEPEITEEQLLSAAKEFDSSNETPISKVLPPKDEASEGSKAQPAESKDGEAVNKDAKETLKPHDGEKKPEADKQLDKTLDKSEVSPENKTEERLSRWEKRRPGIEADLAQEQKRLMEEKLAFAQEKLSMQQKIAELEANTAEATANSKYSPEEYRKWADQALQRAANEPGKAQELREQAEAAYREATKIEAARMQLENRKLQLNGLKEQQAAAFRREWDANVAQAIKENPELNSDTELAFEVKSLLNSEDPGLKHFFNSNPKGILYAVQVGKWKAGAELASDLSKENSELKAKLQERDKRLQPGNGVANTPTGQKRIQDMNESEADDYFHSIAREAS